jgi:hypothetical protein
MKKLFILFACMTALAVLLNVRSASAQGKLEGVWKITEVTLTGPNTRTITNPQPGLFIFTKKHYSMMMITGEKPRPDLPQKDATDAQKVATWTPFTANAGTYEVKGAVLTFHPTVAKNPNGMAPGSVGTCDFKIERNTLTITIKAIQAGPVANPYTMKFTRLE